VIDLPLHTVAFAEIAAHGSSVVVVDLLVILALATVVATIFKRLKLDSIPGFLIAGALAGPSALRLVRSPESVTQISSLATILLMFTIGLHLDVSIVRRGMVHVLAIGVGSTLGVILVAWPLALMLGLPAPAALLVAMGLSMSSTAILVRVIGAKREIASSHGRVGLGIAIVQDIAAVVALALVPPIAKWAGIPSVDILPGTTERMAQLPSWMEFVARGMMGLGGVGVMILVGKYLLPRLIREVTKVGSAELLLVLAGAVALGAAIGTAALGFSPEMGAFLAGFLLAATPYRYQLSGQLVPIRDLLMVVFFTAVGLSLDPHVLATHWVSIAAGTVLLLVLKTLVIALAAWLGGMSGPGAFLTGVYLGNAGEFTLVVIAAGAAAGVLTPDQKGAVIAVVIASLIVSPSLMSPAHLWAQALRHWRLSPFVRTDDLRDSPAPASLASAGQHHHNHIILAGFGPVARALADRFDVRNIRYTVIELNPTTVARQTTIGRHIVYGDATNREVLESAGIHQADGIILTIPDHETVLRACQAIRELAPDIFIAARTAYLSQAFRAHQLGADHVTVEEIATAIAMERDVMRKLEAIELKRQHANARGPTPAPDVAGSNAPAQEHS
jgi:monovalent cation:H+ antiporter-2, CPA2 family